MLPKLSPHVSSTIVVAPEIPSTIPLNPLCPSSEQSRPPSIYPDALEFSNYSSPLSDQPSLGTNTFQPNTSEPISLSLSSQLRRLRESPGCVSGQGTSPSTLQLDDLSHIIVHLPKPARLHHLLEVFFREYDCYLPYLNKSTTERRILKSLEDLQYGDLNCSLYVSSKQSSFFALLCNILAAAEVCNPQEGIEDSIRPVRPGWSMYLQGIRIICQSRRIQIELDLVRYHTIAASYLIVLAYLSPATHAISNAYQLALKLKINDQKAWIGCSIEERGDRQKLWWIIYFIDRLISQKNGTAYIIRDNEIAVEEFTEKPAVRTTNNPGYRTVTDAEKTNLSWTDLSMDDSVDYKFLQILVNISRIWGQIWDTFFAGTTRKLGDLQEIEIMDTRVVFLQRSIPPELDWNSERVIKNVAMGEVETRVRRRLLVYSVSSPTSPHDSHQFLKCSIQISLK
jgi:hypothetical protein